VETFIYFDFRSHERDTHATRSVDQCHPPLARARGRFHPEITRTQNPAHALLHRVIEFTMPARIRRIVHSRCIKNTDEDVVRDNTKRQLLFTFRAAFPRALHARRQPPFLHRALSVYVLCVCVCVCVCACVYSCVCVCGCVRARQSIDLNRPGVTDGKSGEKRAGFHNKRHTQTRAHGRAVQTSLFQ